MLADRGRSAALLVALIASGPARPSLAGESFLDRNSKVHEAVPYGRSAEEGGPRVDETASSGEPATAASASPSGIEGITWRLVALRGSEDGALAGLREGVTIRLEAGRMNGFGGCNRLSGPYTLASDELTIGAVAGTMMACPEPAMAIETAFKNALGGPSRFAVAAGRLTLTAKGETDPRLAFVAAPVAALEGGTWEVTGFNNGRRAVVSPASGTTLTLSFEDGAVVGHAGCNRFRATYTREGDRLSIGSIAATKMACPQEGVLEQERQFLAALESTATWTIDREMLDLHRADGERVLLARHPAK